MPRKIRQLKADLQRAGFRRLPGGKCSHTKWKHPRLSDIVTVSGNDGDDAHAYQEKQVREAIHDARSAGGPQG